MFTATLDLRLTPDARRQLATLLWQTTLAHAIARRAQKLA